MCTQAIAVMTTTTTTYDDDNDDNKKEDDDDDDDNDNDDGDNDDNDDDDDDDDEKEDDEGDDNDEICEHSHTCQCSAPSRTRTVICTTPFSTYLRAYVYARNLHLLLREEASARSARFRYVPMFRCAVLQRKNKRTDARRAVYSSRSLFLPLSFFSFSLAFFLCMRCAALHFFPLATRVQSEVCFLSALMSILFIRES